MKRNFGRLARVATTLSVGMLMLSATLGAARAADSAPDRAAVRAQHHQDWIRARLERSANRLQITASQQAAWREYAAARTALAYWRPGKPARDLDAASLVQQRADRAAENARKLAVLADATTKLQAVLAPEQRETLRQMMQHGPRGHFKHGPHGWRGERDGGRDEGREHATESSPDRDQPAA